MQTRTLGGEKGTPIKKNIKKLGQEKGQRCSGKAKEREDWEIWEKPFSQGRTSAIIEQAGSTRGPISVHQKRKQEDPL